jgi:hypothetical protein
MLLTKEIRYCDIKVEECRFLVFVVKYVNEFELIHSAQKGRPVRSKVHFSEEDP